MKRCAALLGVCVLVAAIGPGSAQAARPKVSLQQHCFPAGLDGEGLAYGINIKLRGLAPSAPFTLKLDEYDVATGEWRGSIGPAEFPADARGRFGPFGFGVVGIPTRYTLTVIYAGRTFIRTATSTCDPALVRQCRGNNWQASSRFESRAACRAFVRELNGRAP